MMMDDERMAHTFSAVCSPPISMMFKGRGRSSSKLKKMEIVTQDEELDEEVCDGLLKISKSSEELWKDVYAVFSPPTPIGSKMPDYMPFDSYKHPSSISTTPPRTTALGVESEANSSQITALDILSNDTGKTSVIPAIQYYPPNYTPPVLNNKYTTTPGTTVTNSIPIQHPQISNTKVQTIKEEDDTNSNSNTNPTNPVVNLKRSKRNSRSLEQPSYSTAKRPPARSASAANINNIINESVEAGETREDGSPRVPRARRHNSADNTIHNNNNVNQQVPLSNFNPQSHTQPQTHLENLNDRSHNLFDNRANPNPSMNSITHLHLNMHNNAVYTGNTPMLDINDQHASNNSTSNQVNYNHVSSLSHDTPNTNHVQYTNNTNTPNSILNMGNALSNNDKYWTEVIFSCKKLVALAGAGLANTLSFAELVDGLTLARHITSTTAAAVMNSGGYTPLQSAPVSDEFNRLVTETLGLPQSNPNQNLFHNQNNTFNPTFNAHPSHTNQQNQPSLHINTNIDNNQNNMFPFFSSPPLNGLPSSPPLYSASSPTYSPSTYPAAPFSHSAPSTPISSSSSNGINSPGVGSPLSLSTPTWSSGSGAFVFEELRKKLPVASSITTKEEDSDESPVDSPSLSPKSPPISGLLVPLSPCLSPGGSSTSSPPVPPEVSVKGEREREAREGRTKEREEKTSWKKPRGKKKRPKYEADLECRSCGVRQTPEWRRGPFGAKTLCNACGLHWAKVLKAEGKGDQKRVALLEAKRSQFMMTQKRAHGTRSASAAAAASGSSSPTSTPIKNEPLYLSPHMSH